MSKPFIDFYNSIGFAPTGQQLELSMTHKRNRDTLYRKLGLHPRVFFKATVLEIGPGSGENALDLLTRGIESLKLVDGVPAVLDSLRNRVTRNTQVTFEVRDASNTIDASTYDIVICEGVLPMQSTPNSFLQNVAKAVKPEGILLITTSDPISSLSEVLRRYCAHTIFEIALDKVEEVVQFFEQDFSALLGMTRNPRDWVLDSINNPWLGGLFSLEDAVKTVGDQLLPISMTPNICPDLDWYKNGKTNFEERSMWVESYQIHSHQLIDCRFNNFPQSTSTQNALLDEKCHEIFSLVQQHILKVQDLPSELLVERLNSILLSCNNILLEETKNSLQGYIDWLKDGKLDHLRDFRSFWGRGQQHLCFKRI